MVVEAITLFLLFLFVISHSVLATVYVKDKINLSQRNYRLLYSIIAIISYLILIELLQTLSVDSGRILISPLIPISSLVSLIIQVLGILGGFFILGSLLQTNLLKFFGILAESMESDLKTGFFYRFSRHPMYFGGLLITVPPLFISNNSVWFLENLIFSLYFIFGAIPEEIRLKNMLQGYPEIMNSRGFLFPWKLKHFKILLLERDSN
ncbi:MAG: methyltransferase family protein [Candidatus Hodarchaeales archaeon]|jgi:protein-S-isoprenylcysteine O-methyltransferase Ste14